jgi:hypothetical protein
MASGIVALAQMSDLPFFFLLFLLSQRLKFQTGSIEKSSVAQ